jgi:hypothetical protein
MIAMGDSESPAAQKGTRSGSGLEDPLTSRERAEMVEIFRDDVERFEELTGRSFRHWLDENS